MLCRWKLRGWQGAKQKPELLKLKDVHRFLFKRSDNFSFFIFASLQDLISSLFLTGGASSQISSAPDCGFWSGSYRSSERACYGMFAHVDRKFANRTWRKVYQQESFPVGKFTKDDLYT